MSQKTHFKVEARDQEIKLITGRFYYTANAAVLDPSRQVGTGYTVARNNPGDFTITLDDPYPYLESASFCVFKTGGTAGHGFSVTAEAVADPKSRNLRVIYKENSGGTFTAVDPGAYNSIGFTLYLRNKASKQ